MIEYEITEFSNGVITIHYNEKFIKLRIPIIDGLYIEGQVLDDYITNYIRSINTVEANNMNIPSNEGNILNLVTSPVYTAEELSNISRINRNKLLNLTDRFVLQDNPIPSEKKLLWIEYRQALRDVTSQTGFPNNILWPIPPDIITTPAGIPKTDINGVPLFK